MGNNNLEKKQSFKEYLKNRKNRMIIPAIILGVSFFSFYRLNMKQGEVKITNSMIIASKISQFANNEYIIRTNANDIYGFHRGANDYVIGSADIFLRDVNGNRVKPKEVKIYAEKDGKKTYFNVYNDRYDFELVLNGVESGEHTIYAEATGNNGKTYREKLWIGGHLRKNITVAGMQGEYRIDEGKIVVNKKETNYIIRTNTNDMYGFHRADGNDYVIGRADIFLSDNNGNRVKPNQVKIYAEKGGKQILFNVYNDKYDYELLLNNIESGEYIIYAEATGNNGKTYKEKLWIGGHLRRNVTVAGMQAEAKVDEGKIIINRKETNYIIRTNTNDMYGFHRADGNDYVIGRADIFLSDNNGNRVKPNQVKIYAEKGGKQILFNVYNDKYDYELLLNNIESGEYTIYAEATGNNGKTYKEKLWIGGHLRRNVTVAGMKTEVRVDEGKIIVKAQQKLQPQPILKLDKTNLNNKLKEVEGLVKGKELTEELKKDKTEDSIRKYNEEYAKISNNLNVVRVNISKLGEDKTSENENKLNNYTKDLENVKNSLNTLNNILKVKPQPVPKLDKTNLNNKLKEVENLVKARELTEELKKDKTEDSIRKYNEEYIKVVAKLNTVKVNISKLGEDKTTENEGKLNQYISELENIKNNLNDFNNILKVKPQPVPKLDKTNLNNKLKEVEGLVKGKELTEVLKKDKTEDSIRKYNEEYTKIVNNLNSVKINISKLGEDKTSENETKLNNYMRDLDNIKNSLNGLNNILKVKEQPKPKLDKTNLNNKLKEVEGLVNGKELTEALKKDKTEDSIRKYNEEYAKISNNLNVVRVNISKLGEEKTNENETKLNNYTKDLENVKNSLNTLNSILKVKPQPILKLDKTNLNNKLKEAEGVVKGKELTEELKKDKTEDSIRKYNEEYIKVVAKLNTVKVNISKLGEDKTTENEGKLNQYISELENIKNNLNDFNNILKVKPQPVPKLDKTNLNNKLKEVEGLVKGKELTEVLKKDKTEDSIRKYNEEYIKVVAKLNTVKVNISKLGEDKTAENEGKLNQYISELENIKNSLSIFDSILKEKEVVVEKKVEFNNVSSIKLFQNSPYGEAWVTILEEVPANVNDYFIKVESNNYRPIILGVKKIEKVGNKYKIFAENDIEYILGENETRNKDITKVAGYDNSKANIYKNIFKLIPYYNLEKVVELGNKVDNSSVLNTKTISKVIPLKDKEVSSSEETRNGLSNKVMIKFADNTVEYYTLENLAKFKEFKEYNINILGAKVLYTPELGIENAKTKQVVDSIKNDFKTIKFYEDKKIWEILDPRIKALDKIKKRIEMKKQLGREVSEEELIRELQKITLEKMSYKDSFENVQKNIDDILNTILINNQNIVSNNVSLESVKKKLTDNKEKVLLGLTYIDRLYNLKYSNVNLKNLILYYPEFFGKKVDIIDFLIMLGSMNHIEYKLNATPETFRKKFNYIFKEQTIPEFLENNKNMFDPSLSINDWFKKSSNAYIVEQKSEYNGELDYLVYNKLKKNSEQKYLLPLLNVSENSVYVITTVTTTTFGLVDTYVDRDGTAEERKIQLNEFENKLKETAKRQGTFLDFWFRIANKDTHHNLISNRIVLDSLRIYNKNPYVNARETWSKEYGNNVSKGISELIVPFDFYREFFVADGEANGLRSKYVSC